MSNPRLTYLSDRLDTLRDAIDAIEGGSQSWSSPDGMSYTHADLATLYAQQRRIESEISMLDPVPGNSYGAQSFSFACRR